MRKRLSDVELSKSEIWLSMTRSYPKHPMPFFRPPYPFPPTYYHNSSSPSSMTRHPPPLLRLLLLLLSYFVTYYNYHKYSSSSTSAADLLFITLVYDSSSSSTTSPAVQYLYILHLQSTLLPSTTSYLPTTTTTSTSTSSLLLHASTYPLVVTSTTTVIFLPVLLLRQLPAPAQTFSDPSSVTIEDRKRRRKKLVSTWYVPIIPCKHEMSQSYLTRLYLKHDHIIPRAWKPYNASGSIVLSLANLNRSRHSVKNAILNHSPGRNLVT